MVYKARRDKQKNKKVRAMEANAAAEQAEREATHNAAEMTEEEAADESTKMVEAAEMTKGKGKAPEVPRTDNAEIEEGEGQGVEEERGGQEGAEDIKEGTKRGGQLDLGINDTPLGQPLRITGHEENIAELNKAAAEDQPARTKLQPKRRRRTRTKHKRVAASPPPEAPLLENPLNQGVPGSEQQTPPDQQGLMKEEIEDGQRQQDDADDILKDPRVIRLQQSLELQNEELRTEYAKLQGDIKDRDMRIAHHEGKIASYEKDRLRAAELYKNSQWEVDNLQSKLVEAKDKETEAIAAKDEANAEKDKAIKKADVSKKAMEYCKSQLLDREADIRELKAELEVDKVLVKGLNERIDELEDDVASKQAVATENTTLQQQIQQVHTSFEEAFSDMTKGLTINEKFAYVREHQAGPSRIVSGTSLDEELEHLSNASSSEHHEPPPKEILSFSDITTVETAPIVAPVATANPVSSRAPLALSSISAVETSPTAGPKPTTTIMAVERPVHYRSYTPWWVWLVMSVALLACLGGFAALVRERQIWIDANSMAYQRLMGGHQETWVEWIGLGVESLICSIHGGRPIGLGRSYYG